MILTPEERAALGRRFGRWQHPRVLDRRLVSQLGDGSEAEVHSTLDLLARLLTAPTPDWAVELEGKDPWAALGRRFARALREHLEAGPGRPDQQARASGDLMGLNEPLVGKLLGLMFGQEHYRHARRGLHTLIEELRKLAAIPCTFISDSECRSPVGWDRRSSYDNAVRDAMVSRLDVSHRATDMDPHDGDSAIAFVLGLLHHNREALERLLPAPSASSVDLGGPMGAALTEVRVRQEAYLRTFVGRESELRSAIDWIEINDHGRYLLLVGEPGLGKSAFMARLARTLEEEGRTCIFHMVGVQRDALSLLNDLVERAAVILGRPRAGRAASTIDSKRAELVELLTELGRGERGCVLLVDALDELADTSTAELILPPALPPGLRGILTARDDPRLRRSLSRHGGEVRPLARMGAHDFSRMLDRIDSQVVRRMGEAAILSVFDRVEGNALLMTDAAAAVSRAWDASGEDLGRLDLSGVSATLAEVFEKRLDELDRLPEGRERLDLLELLCAAREPLSPGDLSELSGVDDRACSRFVAEMSAACLRNVGDRRHEPFHQGLRDHVLGRLSPTRRTSIEARFCDWLERAEPSLTYALTHRIDHLLAARRAEEAGSLLLTPRFLELKVQGGRGHELPGEMVRVAAALPSTHERREALELVAEALRHDLRLITSHPTTLFQCLWNRLWWHDAPGAADHYEPLTEDQTPPWVRPGPFPLHAWVEKWRATRPPEAPWLRSVLPPPERLGTGQHASGAVRFEEAAFVPCLALTSDCRAIVGYGRELQIVNFDEGRTDLLELPGHLLHVTPAGTHLAFMGDEGPVLRDLTSGEECAVDAEGVDGWSVWSSSGRVAVGWPDEDEGLYGDVEVLDATGEVVRAIAQPGHAFRALAISPDGKRLALLCRPCPVSDPAAPGQLVLLDVDSGAALPLALPCDSVETCVFDAAGKRLAVLYSRPYTAWIVFDTRTGQTLAESARGDADTVVCLALSPDGRRLATGGDVLALWDVGARGRGFAYPSIGCEVSRVAFSPDGTWIATAHMWSTEGSIRLWQIDPRERGAEVHRRASGQVALALSSTAGTVATIDDGDQLRLWSPRSGLETARFESRTGYSVQWLAKTFVLTISDWSCPETSAYDVQCRDTSTGNVTVQDRALWPIVTDVEAGYLAFRSPPRTIVVWDVAAGRTLTRIEGPPGFVVALAVSPGALRVAALSPNSLSMWSVADSELSWCLPMAEPLEPERTDSLTLRFSRDGKGLRVERRGHPPSALWSADGALMPLAAGDWCQAEASEALPAYIARTDGSEVALLDGAAGPPVAWIQAMSHVSQVGTCVAGLRDRHFLLFEIQTP